MEQNSIERIKQWNKIALIIGGNTQLEDMRETILYIAYNVMKQNQMHTVEAIRRPLGWTQGNDSGLEKKINWLVTNGFINLQFKRMSLYENGLTLLPKYKNAFVREGNHELYETKLREYKSGKELYNKGLASRYLYIVA